MTTTRIVSGWLLAVLFSIQVSAGVEVGDSPTLSATAIDGSTVDLAKLKGKLVLIDFWVGRSDANKINERELLQIHKDFAEQGLVIIGVCCDPKIEWARNNIADLKIPWQQIHEPNDWRGGLGKEWGVPKVNWEYLIAPDGKVVYVGHVNSIRGQIESALHKYPPKLVDPDVLAKANEKLDEVDKLLADKDREAAVSKFARIGDEAMKDRPYARRYKELQGKINETADALLAEADAIVQAKSYPAAAARLKELSSAMADLPSGSKARRKLAELTSTPDVQREMELTKKNDDAQAALLAARAVRDAGENEAAYGKFKAVAQDYPDTSAGKQAADAVKAYESDTAFMLRYREHAVEGKAKAALALADNYTSAGQTEKARRKYEEIVKEFAGTRFADTARRQLEKLQ